MDICVYEIENTLAVNSKRRAVVEKACGVLLSKALATENGGVYSEYMPEYVWMDSTHEAEDYIKDNGAEPNDGIAGEDPAWWAEALKCVRHMRSLGINDEDFSFHGYTSEDELYAWAWATITKHCQAYHAFTKQTILVLK